MRHNDNNGNALDSINAGIGGLNVQSYLVRQQMDRQLLLSGRMASWRNKEKERVCNLGDAEFRIYSQWGEDGIIDWLVEHVPMNRNTFVEFGVENYQESNTRFLLQNRNWRGLIFDGNKDYMESVRKEDIYWKYDINAVCAFITRDNIDSLLLENGMEGDIGLLSIDIDGNDYWVLKDISVISPRILICEYNPVFGDLHAITVPYKVDFERLNSHHCGLYFGASIKAVCKLAESKGYSFAGTCSNGINAFFVRNDIFGSVSEKIRHKKAFPSRHRDARDCEGNLVYTPGLKRAELIKEMPVIDLDHDDRTVLIGELGDLYSNQWLQEMS
jgi:hypothetical protein